MKCSKCGNIVLNHDPFCGKCGAPATYFVQEVRPAEGVELPTQEVYEVSPAPVAEVPAPQVNTADYPPVPPATYIPQPPESNQQYVPAQNYYVPPVPVYNQAPVITVPKKKATLTAKGKRMLLLGSIAMILVLAIIAAGVFVVLPRMGIDIIGVNKAEISEFTNTLDYSGIIAAMERYNYNQSIEIGFDFDGKLCVIGKRNLVFGNAQSGEINSLNDNKYNSVVNMETHLVNYIQCSNGEEIAEEYAVHLEEIWGNDVTYICGDMDSDGNVEYIYFIRNFLENWNTESGGFWVQDIIDEAYYKGQVCIYADISDEAVLFNTFYIFDGNDANYSCRYNEGNLFITLNRGADGEGIRLFCGRVEDAKEDYENDKEILRNLTKAYAKHLILESPYRVGVKIVDICQVSGEEAIFVLSDGNYALVYVEAFYYGRPINLYYDKGESGCAVYLVKYNGGYRLMEYYQSTYNSGGIKTRYGYEFVGFDDAYASYREGGKSIELWDSKVPTTADNQFFTDLNGYLDGGVVCADPFELTGYTSMTEIAADFNQNQDGKYLNITNCNTNKVGRVAVNWDSWLNLRRGPSVKEDKVLLYSYDKKSFVKQMNGSSVTIIDTVNTGDNKNPIWVEIQIKYEGLTLVGYSSQSFIDIPNIKHLRVGESFTINVSTNDTGLYWYSNDSSVLSVNSSTGVATAKQKGLVMVQVTSASGLTDSCLIMVD